MFWKTVAQFFPNKSNARNKITLSENEKLDINDQKCAEVFNNYFNSIFKVDQCDTIFNNFLLHLRNHNLNNFYMLNTSRC